MALSLRTTLCVSVLAHRHQLRQMLNPQSFKYQAPSMVIPSVSPSMQHLQLSDLALPAPQQRMSPEHNIQHSEISHDTPPGTRALRQSPSQTGDTDFGRQKSPLTLSSVLQALSDVISSS